ncbi:MAG: hypothetical protein ABIR16_02830, partial [Dokdonella sp.]
ASLGTVSVRAERVLARRQPGETPDRMAKTNTKTTQCGRREKRLTRLATANGENTRGSPAKRLARLA